MIITEFGATVEVRWFNRLKDRDFLSLMNGVMPVRHNGQEGQKFWKATKDLWKKIQMYNFEWARFRVHKEWGGLDCAKTFAIVTGQNNSYTIYSKQKIMEGVRHEGKGVEQYSSCWKDSEIGGWGTKFLTRNWALSRQLNDIKITKKELLNEVLRRGAQYGNYTRRIFKSRSGVLKLLTEKVLKLMLEEIINTCDMKRNQAPICW